MIDALKQYKGIIPNALKSFLVIELPTYEMHREKAMVFLNQVKEYVRKELGYYENPEDNSLIILVFPSNRVNVQLLNSPYDAWERFEDTLSQKFENIEEFIKSIYYENSCCS